jgi:hypothetical protein
MISVVETVLSVNLKARFKCFLPGICIPSSIHLPLNVTVVRKTSGRSLGRFRKSDAVSAIEEQLTESSFTMLVL